MSTDTRFGQTVKKYRKLNGMTQAELAARVGLKNRSGIAKIEAGIVSADVEMVRSLANALNTSIADLTKTALEEDRENYVLRFLPYLIRADDATLSACEKLLGMR